MSLAYGIGGLLSVPPAPIRGQGAPPANFKGQLGQMYIDQSASPADIYFYNGTTWQITTSELDTLTTDDATVVTPVSGNINLVGGTNINTTGAGASATINLDSSPSVSGSITAGTGLVATTGGVTATAGNITATNGNIVRGTAGNKDVYSSVGTTTAAGANSAGTVALAGGTATVATTAVTAASQIRLYRQGIGATGAAALGILTLGTVTASTSFVIRAVQAADATALQASDVSVIGWEIVN